MKKLFAALIVFTLIFAACANGTTTAVQDPTTLRIKNESSKTITGVVWNNNSFGGNDNPFIGTWNNDDEDSLEIHENTWTLLTNVPLVSDPYDPYFASIYLLGGSGSYNKAGDILNLYGVPTLYPPDGNIPEQLLFTASISGETKLTLTGKGDVSLVSIQLTKPPFQFTPGSNTNKTVSSGSGYIFFTVGSTDYRTSELVAVDSGDNEEFTFTNNTLVVNITSPGTPVTLGSLE